MTYVKTYIEQSKATLSIQDRLPGKSIFISRFNGLTLSRYIEARLAVCSVEHKKPCGKCDGLLKVAKVVVEEGVFKLKDAFLLCSPGVTYKAENARRKLLQMPLAAIGAGSAANGTFCYYLTAKQDSVSYSILQSLLNRTLSSHDSNPGLSKEEMKKLLYLANGDEAQREYIKYTAVKSSGLSATKAKAVYGFHMSEKRKQRVVDVAEEAEAIKCSIEKIAAVKEDALLKSFGLEVECSSEDSETSSETDTDLEACCETGEAQCVQQCLARPLVTESSVFDEDSPVNNATSQLDISKFVNADECYKHQTDMGDIEMNSHQLVDILRKCQLNWFQFVQVITEMMELSKESIDQLLLDFAGQLPYLGLSTDSEKMVEQSRQAYLLQERLEEQRRDRETGLVMSESETSEEELWACGVNDPLDENGRKIVQKKIASVRRKAAREAKRRLAERRFLKRRRSKRVGSIIRECPGIGEEIESFVRSCGAGADSWRRTGALTFDGNRKLKKKATFKRVKEHLEEKYKRKISYGTVVQLCQPRNKRRKSASRYKCLANVVHKRARKGFNVRYNPDEHWSAALYASLEQLQYTDGQNIMNLGRDDQAGFRLDTTASHKQHVTLCVRGNEPLTTRTDYTNKYPSTLQTTSYNFPGTSTTGELCAGIVKAPGIFEKNPAQHAADLTMIESQEEVKAAFGNPASGTPKEIECVRVDGSSDEGPAHLEVQYWWTKRHLQKGSRATMVSSRNSGASYKNRVELQNGCLALAHSNMYIPSTLNGSCQKDDGQVNKEVLHKNLDAAIDVYISRVDKAPCAGTEIHLFKGANSTANQKESKLLKVYLKGSKKAKEQLRKDHPQDVENFETIWQLRESHLLKDLPLKYVFYLLCCYQSNCIHPLCKKGKPSEDPCWFPGGPPLTFVPVPTPDPERPFGNPICLQCKELCSGHYMKPEKLWQNVCNEGTVAKASPPSCVILGAYSGCKGMPSEDVIQETARNTLLPVAEVTMWFEHLAQIQVNRRKGAEKAAKTRKEKKRKGSRQSTAKQSSTNLQRDNDASSRSLDEDICSTCSMAEPPNDPDTPEDVVSWISCDGCCSWHHHVCVGLTETPEKWLCLKCSEQW